MHIYSFRLRFSRFQLMYLHRRRFANFFFGWDLDAVRTRLIYYEVPDVSGRNIKHFGKSIVHYVRWVEQGYRSELMRLTDFMNSLPLPEREQLVELTRLKLVRPSEELVFGLWDLAKGFLCFEDFYRRYMKSEGK